MPYKDKLEFKIKRNLNLIPCCHCDSIELDVICIDPMHYRVRCRGCNAVGPTGATEKSAIDWWNTRDHIEDCKDGSDS